MIAQIAVSAAIYAIDKPYSYWVPPQLSVAPGMRVLVPFSQGNRRVEGMVLAVTPGEETGLKSVAAVLDETPVLSESLLHLAAFLRERYFCTFYDAVKAMLPAGLWFSVQEEWTLEVPVDEAKVAKSHRDALAILQAAADRGGVIRAQELRQAVDPALLERYLPYLQNKHYLRSNRTFDRRVRDKSEEIASLAVPWEEAVQYAQSKARSAPMQREVLTLLTQLGSVSAKELCYFTGATMATVRRLERLGFLSLSLRPVFRTPLPPPGDPVPLPVLNESQNAAYTGLAALQDREKPGAALLYGVTGSGKTSVYVRLIARTLEQGRSAVLLVPEIALTPQLIATLVGYFGKTVAVLHSGLRVTERYDEWRRIRQGGARVVIGTRSAVFAPVQQLGLLIVDEEQEHSYKSENSPRYHAREAALYRGAKEGALVLLGSATPSVETMYLARQGTYALFTLGQRFHGGALPEVRIVDLKEELRRGNGTSISLPLQEALRETMDQGRQSILFLNRRGAGQYRICVQCGAVPTCPRCSVSLTYHAANHRLLCHYCGHSEPVQDRCPQCGGMVKTMGVGTQRIEAELRTLFPDREILRMDADTVSATNTHEDILSRFEREKIPILVGTQMVTKGLNFENVTLVGVIDADLSLYVNHFRAAETTFSLLTQVVGRAGRGQHQGRALIQTMSPQHRVIELAARQDYDAFFSMELSLRQLQGLPPFRDLFTVTFLSRIEGWAVSGAARFRAMVLRQSPGWGTALTVLGPSPAPVVKVNNTFRYRLVLQTSGSRPLRRHLAAVLKAFLQDRANRGVTAYVDINSYE
ncbi:MAG TPA: primosomal protein N' [Candidatus Avoscillospira stercorigallinarum]|uniref:Replication restart protein PriA n=1 Tax=Candidatus Avoscillospira stercorigallinarum TaxID=2840708 RepID=A0A9D1CP67_9FIRM|nr:primosomal protein N' [Candidatus Avoscillospira stercorigallinarum]